MPSQNASRHVPSHNCITRWERTHAATSPRSMCRLCEPRLGGCHTRSLLTSRRVYAPGVPASRTPDYGDTAPVAAQGLPPLATTVEAARHGLPGARPFGHVAPGGPGTDEPQDAVEDAAVVSGWATWRRFLWGKQGLYPLPLPLGEGMSMHPRKETTRNRVCKHALVPCLTPALSHSVNSDALPEAHGHQHPLAPQAELGHTTNSGGIGDRVSRCMRCCQVPCTCTCGVTLPESPLL
jgi:hypothetical protein